MSEFICQQTKSNYSELLGLLLPKGLLGVLFLALLGLLLLQYYSGFLLA